MSSRTANKRYLESGMHRLLRYNDCLVEDNELRNMCEKCEKYCGEDHQYEDCKDCQGFKFYCELEEYRFADTF